MPLANLSLFRAHESRDDYCVVTGREHYRFATSLVPILPAQFALDQKP